ncbi:MAG: YihY/virulence factor BrkB family protein [Candidatus Cyclobacteriaceae bacterium M3_2C_046]
MKIKHHIKKIFSLIKETVTNWNDDDPWRLSAVVAYYALFSLPGLIIIVITALSPLLGDEMVRDEIYMQIKDLIGQEGARQVQTMVQNASLSDKSMFQTIIGIGTLLFASTGVFFHLKTSINQIWGVKAVPKQAFLKMLLDRIFSFGMILVIGFLLLVSLLISSALSALSNQITQLLPEYSIYFFRLLDIAINLVIITILFALMYRVLPDVRIKWKDVFVGALVTAILFVLGKFLVGFYLGKAEPGSTYGAAGSIILILLWVSYTSLILFFGVEFTQVYSKYYGTRIKPSKFAVRLPDPERKKALSYAQDKEKDKDQNHQADQPDNNNEDSTEKEQDKS